MIVKFKKLRPDAVIPRYSKPGDAGMDLTSISRNDEEYFTEFGTGIAVEIPEGYVGLLFPRSSVSKTHHILANHVGVIDSGYRGEIKLRFKSLSKMATYKGYPDVEYALIPNGYNVGDKVGQLIILPYPRIELIEVNELSDSERKSDGFGSTGT
jgi:dUTP pyrophosphatase